MTSDDRKKEGWWRTIFQSENVGVGGDPRQGREHIRDSFAFWTAAPPPGSHARAQTCRVACSGFLFRLTFTSVRCFIVETRTCSPRYTKEMKTVWPGSHREGLYRTMFDAQPSIARFVALSFARSLALLPFAIPPPQRFFFSSLFPFFFSFFLLPSLQRAPSLKYHFSGKQGQVSIPGWIRYTEIN